MKQQGIAEKYNSAFATKLRELMDEHGTKQDALAEYIGKSRQAVSQYINGLSEPVYKTLGKIASFFDVSTDYLLGLTDVRNVSPEIKSICQYTGLSEDAVEQIKRLQSDSDRDFSELLTNPDFISLVDEILKYSVSVKVDYCAEMIRQGLTLPKEICTYLTATEHQYLSIVLQSYDDSNAAPLIEILDAQKIGLLSDLADARAKRRLSTLLSEIEADFINKYSNIHAAANFEHAKAQLQQFRENHNGND